MSDHWRKIVRAQFQQRHDIVRTLRGDDLLGIEQINLTTFTDDTLVKTINGEPSVLAAANSFDEVGNHMLNSNNFVAENGLNALDIGADLAHNCCEFVEYLIFAVLFGHCTKILLEFSINIVIKCFYFFCITCYYLITSWLIS